MQVVHRANNLIEAHLAKHALEAVDIPAFVFGESLLGGAGELPLFGVLQVCVPDSFLDEATACLRQLALEEGVTGEDLGDGDAVPAR